ncbi:hypothetical protein C8Q80DRAFT_1265735 [Daedaleopsis nitida]|nr:hypothetical protein C8Q80DRAFT_1265735 [Daedaleopsis nitida]
MDVPSFTALISNIHIPVHCRVFVDYIPFSVTPSSEIFSLIRSLPGDISSNCTCMGIHFRACTLLEAKLELPTIIPGFNGRRGVACGGACVVLREVNREEVDRFWDFICARAVMERLEEVRINIDNKAGWAGEWTARILSSLVNVRRLALSFQDPICKSSFRDGPFNVVLAPLGPFKTATLELACPDLQDLDIYVDTSEYQPAMEAIANMLARRAARNKPVRRLVLYAAEPVDSRFDLSKHVTEYTLRIIMFPTNWTPLGWGEWPHVPDDNLADGGHEPIGMDWTTW